MHVLFDRFIQDDLKTINFVYINKMHSSAKLQYPPLSVIVFCSCDKVYHNQVHFINDQDWQLGKVPLYGLWSPVIFIFKFMVRFLDLIKIVVILTSPGPARAGRVCRAAQGDSGAPATRGQIWGRLVT